MQDVMDEFTAIILDTYKKLKKESTMRSVYGSSQTSQINQTQGTAMSTTSQQQ